MSRGEPVELPADELDLGPYIEPGDGIGWGQACAEPVALVDALLDLAPTIPDLRAFVGLSWRELSSRIPEGLRVVSYGWLGQLSRMERLEVVPCHFSALPALFAARKLPGDVALIQVSEFKYKVIWTTANFVDLMIIDTDTVSFLFTIFPALRWIVALCVIALLAPRYATAIYAFGAAGAIALGQVGSRRPRPPDAVIAVRLVRGAVKRAWSTARALLGSDGNVEK